MGRDSFRTGFNAWNALDIDVNDAWTALKRRTYSDTSDAAAEEAYRVFTREVFSTFQEHHTALVAKALSVSPNPPSPSFAALWRRWRDQAALFRPEHVAVQAQISELEGSYRELTRRLEVGEREAGLRWLEHRAALNDLMLELLALRRSLASASGEPSYLAFRLRELGRLDFPAAAGEHLHTAVERLVVPEVVKLRSQVEPEEPPVGDPDALLSGVEAMFTGLDPDFGRVIRELRPDFVDLSRRPNKADTNEQWFFPRAGRAYLHVTSPSMATLLHECGHAVHATLAFGAHPSLWNAYAPDEFQEFAATAFELLCWPLYGEAGLSPRQGAALHVRDLRFYLNALLETAREDAFEYAVYGETPPGSAAELDELWLTVTRRFFPWRAGDDDPARTGWQRGNWSLFRIPLYQSAYTVAIVGALLLARRAQEDRAGVLSDLGAALTLGATAPLPELFARVGLGFPFGEEDVEEAVAFALERLAHFTPLAEAPRG